MLMVEEFVSPAFTVTDVGLARIVKLRGSVMNTVAEWEEDPLAPMTVTVCGFVDSKLHLSVDVCETPRITLLPLNEQLTPALICVVRLTVPVNP
jgi:hypothetical protein